MKDVNNEHGQAAGNSSESGRRSEWGAIKRKKGSPFLYVSFPYFGQRIEKPTKLRDTPEGREKAREFLDRCRDKIEKGTFRFDEAFPGASEKEKAKYAALEGRQYRRGPDEVLFGDYATHWEKTVLPTLSASSQHNYRYAIGPHLRPHFGSMTFRQINGVVLVNLVRQLKCLCGPRKGEPMSPSRKRNICAAFSAIWDDACEEHGWDLPHPMDYLRRKNKKGKVIARGKTSRPEVLRYDEWIRVVQAMKPFFRPMVELMIKTGLHGAEVATLMEENIRGRILHVDGTKNEYRVRNVPITESIARDLNVLRARTKDGGYLFTTTRGGRFTVRSFCQDSWATAFRRSGVRYRGTYVLRHSFAAWSFAIGVHPERLVRLMGHANRDMVYGVYGKKYKGLLADKDKILQYFGEDFLRAEVDEDDDLNL